MKKLTERHTVLLEQIRMCGECGITLNYLKFAIKDLDKFHLFNKRKSIHNALEKLIKWGLIRKEQGKVVTTTTYLNYTKSPRYYILTPIDIVRNKLNGQTEKVAN